MISRIVVYRDAVFKSGFVLAVTLLLFAPLCYASTILTSNSSVAPPTYSSTFPVSDGSDGIFQPTQGVMLDLVPDAVFNFSTITIGSSISVGFNRNSSDVPIYFLATGDILIDGVLNGGIGPLYIATLGGITLNGDLLGQELTLSGSRIVLSENATINGTTIVLSAGNQSDTQPGTSALLPPGSQLRLESPGSIQIASVPVPPSFGLLLTGLIPMWLAGMVRLRNTGRRGG